MSTATGTEAAPNRTDWAIYALQVVLMLGTALFVLSGVPVPYVQVGVALLAVTTWTLAIRTQSRFYRNLGILWTAVSIVLLAVAI